MTDAEYVYRITHIYFIGLNYPWNYTLEVDNFLVGKKSGYLQHREEKGEFDAVSFHAFWILNLANAFPIKKQTNIFLYEGCEEFLKYLKILKYYCIFGSILYNWDIWIVWTNFYHLAFANEPPLNLGS